MQEAECLLINAKATTGVVIQFTTSFNGILTVYNCEGKVLIKQKTKFNKGIATIEIPESGMAILNIKGIYALHNCPPFLNSLTVIP